MHTYADFSDGESWRWEEKAHQFIYTLWTLLKKNGTFEESTIWSVEVNLIFWILQQKESDEDTISHSLSFTVNIGKEVERMVSYSFYSTERGLYSIILKKIFGRSRLR